MGKSNAKKKREHIERQHSRNPELSRGTMAHFSTHERKTKTKQEALQHMMKKHKKGMLMITIKRIISIFILLFCDN